VNKSEIAHKIIVNKMKLHPELIEPMLSVFYDSEYFGNISLCDRISLITNALAAGTIEEVMPAVAEVDNVDPAFLRFDFNIGLRFKFVKPYSFLKQVLALMMVEDEQDTARAIYYKFSFLYLKKMNASLPMYDDLNETHVPVPKDSTSIATQIIQD
jgi:hypothetical protein